ncbi:MAG: linear amide C-N hydrolase [Bacteroidales bacterium]|nr:linear amide C-N hydrolase [Bacteroidota bacterium]MBL6949299.1 linear amide C-N hydrolase [Bacteroidales bacterium]
MSKLRTAILFIGLLIIAKASDSKACTRVVYQGPNGTIITARSMDWKDDILSNMWIFPRGLERNGEAGPNSLKWRSKYGSVILSGYDICTTDGMNEKGLVANLLWLVESEYPEYDGNKPGLSIAAWTQYVLDNFQTVAEAVTELAKEEFVVVTSFVPGSDRLGTLHLSISDTLGDNAIFEYIDGKLVIHHDRSYQVMTNSPTYDKQLALNEYWEEIGGTTFLPGTNRAADRFARASFYVNAIPQTDNIKEALASMFGVIRNCSVPFGISTPDQPNISSTRWVTVADQKNKTYYFESALTPNIFWVDLNDLDFSVGAPTKKLAIAHGEIYTGNVDNDFRDAQPFKFLGL